MVPRRGRYPEDRAPSSRGSGRGFRKRTFLRRGPFKTPGDRPAGRRRIIRPIPLIRLISPADVITLMNFLCGVIAVMLSVDGGDGFRIAMLLILAGIVFDGLDGPVARKFGSSHRFGVWLDSIADAVTFCIAPSILVYNMFTEHGENIFSSFQNFIVVAAALSLAITGILRLARFSISHHRWRDFIGLPTPAMAMVVVSLCSLHFWALEIRLDVPGITTGELIVIPSLLFALSWSMVADVTYRKYRGRSLLPASFVLLVMLISLVAGVQEPWFGMFGALLFSTGAFAYIISPLFQPGKVWGASKRAVAIEDEGEQPMVGSENLIDDESVAVMDMNDWQEDLHERDR